MKAVSAASAASGIPEGVAVALPDVTKLTKASVIGQPKPRFNFLFLRSFYTLLKYSPSARRNTVLFALMFLVVVFPHLVRAEDLLASQKTDANDTFGHGSTVEWTLYIAEIIVSVVGYIKTRNPMVFGGMIIVLLITKAFYSLAG